MSNYMSNVATSVFPVGNITVKGIMGCTVAGSFSASFQLTNDCITPVFNMAGTLNLWVSTRGHVAN